jgi:hypothetical protein
LYVSVLSSFCAHLFLSLFLPTTSHIRVTMLFELMFANE